MSALPGLRVRVRADHLIDELSPGHTVVMLRISFSAWLGAIVGRLTRRNTERIPTQEASALAQSVEALHAGVLRGDPKWGRCFMNALANLFLVTSALIIFMLGAAHLLITFRGQQLHPRDTTLHSRLREVSPVISSKTTMWKAWVGFNASHGFGALLFGLVYGHLALVQDQVLWNSPFLLAVGLLMLGGYAFLGWRYWFSIPFRGIALAAALYVMALIAFAL